jgi:hypothetical protein
MWIGKCIHRRIQQSKFKFHLEASTCVHAILLSCVGTGFAMDRSLIQGVLLNFQKQSVFHKPEHLRRYSNGLQTGRPGFDSRQGQEILLFSTGPRPSLGPTQPPIQWVPGALSPGVKRSGRLAGHLLPSSAEVKNDGAISPSPLTFSCRGA